MIPADRLAQDMTLSTHLIVRVLMKNLEAVEILWALINLDSHIVGIRVGSTRKIFVRMELIKNMLLDTIILDNYLYSILIFNVKPTRKEAIFQTQV